MKYNLPPGLQKLADEMDEQQREEHSRLNIPKKIRAIETEYKGYLFRSRLEARWAVVFDALGLSYDYEPEGFEFEDGTRYLPDFFVKDTGWFVEVKPYGLSLTQFEEHKIKMLDDNPPKDSEGNLLAWGCLVTPELDEITGLDLEEHTHKKNFFMRLMPVSEKWNYKVVNEAILKAKKARFEHGQAPRI